jgi:hypothetical protein
LLRQLFQDSLDPRAGRETRLYEVFDSDGVEHGAAEGGRERVLASRFGQVIVERIAYRGRELADLHPADAVLNLPAKMHSHGLRRLAAIEPTRGSFTDAAAAIQRATGVRVAKRQVEELTALAATDVDAFYTAWAAAAAPDTEVLAMQYDGKGVVVRPDALREATAKTAASRKLSTRLSRGEQRSRKRMAEVACVYDLTPQPRTATDILPPDDQPRGKPRPAPTTHGKWLTASLTADTAQVICAGFDEATRRDPDQQRAWVALVDGNRHQIDRIRAEARTRHLTVPIVVDFVHVLEYLSAPRSARLYPPFSGEGLEEDLWVRWLTRNPKGNGGSSMPVNRGHAQAYGMAYPGGPRDMAKAKLPESQCPEGASRTPAGKTPETGAAPCIRVQRWLLTNSPMVTASTPSGTLTRVVYAALSIGWSLTGPQVAAHAAHRWPRHRRRFGRSRPR